MPCSGSKVRVPVRIALLRQHSSTGSFFLLNRSRLTERSETITELLDRAGPFIPFEQSHDGSTVLVARHHLKWVSVETADGKDALGPPPSEPTREELVEVQFTDSEKLRGLMILEVPHATRRASDFMNDPGTFFRIIAPDGFRLVNKQAVLTLTVFETSPVPRIFDEDLRAV